MILNTQDIIKIIPHRYPFLMVDKVIHLVPGVEITGIKNVTANEHQFVGHFPNHPVMPGVLTIEAMAQLSAILAGKTIVSDNKICYLVSIENAKFKQVITSGDTMLIHSKVDWVRNNSLWRFSSEVRIKECEDKIAASSTFTAIVKNVEHDTKNV